jgi:hypothetical protein
MAKVYVQLHKAEESDATNTAATRPVYAIIGMGYSAIVNHSTLRLSDWGKARIAGMEVVHVHEGDPWPDYVDHGMGQWSDLLTLPGYFTQQFGGAFYLMSSKFGGATSTEAGRVTSEPNVRLIRGRVESIKYKKVGKAKKFAIEIPGSPTLIADYVDVCPGPGAMRLTERTKSKGTAKEFSKREMMFDDVLYEEYSKPAPTSPEKKIRRVVGAQTYLNKNIVANVPRACIFGAGPLSGSCIERAHKAGVDEIYWIAASSPLNRSFAPGLRYDDLARLEKDQPLPRRRAPLGNDVLLYPARTNVRFGEGFKIWRVSTAKKGRIQLEFVSGSPRGRKGPRFVDPTDSKRKEPGDLVCDQLIISSGSQDGDDEPGSAAYLTKHIRKDEGNRFTLLKPVPARYKVPGIGQVTVGLRSKDKDIKFRLLGTAGLTHADREKEDEDDAIPSKLALWELSLPAQAHVARVGVTISAACVAQANGFFQKNANDCVNIAHTGELWTVWGNENGLAISRARNQRIDPFTKVRGSPDDKDHPLPKMDDGYYSYRPPYGYWMGP